MCRPTFDEQLMKKIINSERKNLNKWVERIVEDYIEDRAIEDKEFKPSRKKSIQNRTTDSFALSLPCCINFS